MLDETEEGTPSSHPTKTADAELRLTDDGLEMPEFLKGYVGEFTIRTPEITGDFSTTRTGLPTDEFYDGPIAAYPEAGDYHGDLREGLLAISIDDRPETVFEIVDERVGGDA